MMLQETTRLTTVHKPGRLIATLFTKLFFVFFEYALTVVDIAIGFEIDAKQKSKLIEAGCVSYQFIRLVLIRIAYLFLLVQLHD